MAKLLGLARPLLPSIVLIIVLLLAQTLTQLLLPTLMAEIVDRGIVLGNTALIFQVGGIMLGVALVGVVVNVLANYFSARVSMSYGKELRSEVFAYVQKFSLAEYDQFGAASLITRTTNDVIHIQRFAMMALRMMVMAPLMMVGGVVMAMSRDVQLSRVLIYAMPALILGVILLSSKAMPIFRSLQLKLDKLNLVLRENLTGIRVIRAFNRGQHEEKRFDEANMDLTATAIKVNKLMAVAMPSMILLMNFSAVAVIWLGSHRIDAGDMQVGDLMAFLQYIMQIMFSLMMLSMVFVMLPRALASIQRIKSVLETPLAISDPATPAQSSQRGYVEFKDVSFSYPGAEVAAIKNISFTAAPGEVTAILGGTGAGKSTLVSLIPRFYDVDSGQILVDGIDVREYTQKELRARIGLVPQQTMVFSGTIAENISHGKEHASNEEIMHAAEIAQAREFIDNLPQGFEAEVAQGGANLSGGQKQRLAIARAVVRRPGIYVFDDSFSALDFKTDARLRQALQNELGQSTMLIVAQRVSTVMDAQRIIVLDQGVIVGMGTHQELMETSDVYREIVFSQLAEEEVV